MSGKFDPIRTCIVCGVRLPGNIPLYQMRERGMGFCQVVGIFPFRKMLSKVGI